MFILEKIIALKHLYSKRHDVYALSCPTLRKEVVLKSVTSASTLETEKEEQVKPRVNRRKKKSKYPSGNQWDRKRQWSKKLDLWNQ